MFSNDKISPNINLLIFCPKFLCMMTWKQKFNYCWGNFQIPASNLQLLAFHPHQKLQDSIIYLLKLARKCTNMILVLKLFQIYVNNKSPTCWNFQMQLQILLLPVHLLPPVDKNTLVLLNSFLFQFSKSLLFKEGEHSRLISIKQMKPNYAASSKQPGIPLWCIYIFFIIWSSFHGPVINQIIVISLY